jgi:DNA-binding response OmpR family regulator
VLQHFYRQHNRVLGRAEVLQALRGDDTFFSGRRLDVYITRLHCYLRADAEVQIVNIRGLGYKLML